MLVYVCLDFSLWSGSCLSVGSVLEGHPEWICLKFCSLLDRDTELYTQQQFFSWFLGWCVRSRCWRLIKRTTVGTANLCLAVCVHDISRVSMLHYKCQIRHQPAFLLIATSSVSRALVFILCNTTKLGHSYQNRLCASGFMCLRKWLLLMQSECLIGEHGNVLHSLFAGLGEARQTWLRSSPTHSFSASTGTTWSQRR